MNIKKIIKETIDDFDWAGGIPETPSMDKQLHLGATFMVRDYNMRLKVDFVDSDVVYLTIISSDVEGEPIGEELEMTIVECMDLLKSGYWGYEVQNSMNESDDFDWVDQSGVETPFSWLINNFGNLTPIVMGDKTFYVDDNNKPIFYYNQDEEDGDCHIDYNEIWLVLRTHFGFKYEEIEKITTRWLDEVYGITGRKPQ